MDRNDLAANTVETSIIRRVCKRLTQFVNENPVVLSCFMHSLGESKARIFKDMTDLEKVKYAKITADVEAEEEENSDILNSTTLLDAVIYPSIGITEIEKEFRDRNDLDHSLPITSMLLTDFMVEAQAFLTAKRVRIEAFRNIYKSYESFVVNKIKEEKLDESEIGSRSISEFHPWCDMILDHALEYEEKRLYKEYVNGRMEPELAELYKKNLHKINDVPEKSEDEKYIDSIDKTVKERQEKEKKNDWLKELILTSGSFNVYFSFYLLSMGFLYVVRHFAEGSVDWPTPALSAIFIALLIVIFIRRKAVPPKKEEKIEAEIKVTSNRNKAQEKILELQNQIYK